MPLIDAVGQARRLAVVGLAKNTGKTTALANLIPRLAARGERLGVTSVGRDGESTDVLDSRVRKPDLALPRGSLVATTEPLLGHGAVSHEVLARTGLRTPLGRVVVARLRAPDRVQIAGPSTGAGLAEVSDLMRRHGTDRVLIDGSIDRRVPASPDVADGVVVAVGAVLGSDPDTVVARTIAAVDLMRLPPVTDARVRDLAATTTGSALVTGGGRRIAIDRRLPLAGSTADVARALRAHPTARHVIIKGALREPFVRGALHRDLTLIVDDCTKVFLTLHDSRWYAQRGVRIVALRPVRLCAVTVNPTAPGAHRLPQLHRRIRAALPGTPVFDVLSEDMLGGDVPSEDVPSEDVPSEDVPSEDVPAPKDLVRPLARHLDDVCTE